MTDDETQISEFLLKLKLTKYTDKFKSEPLNVRKVTDFSRFLQEPNYLKEAGLTVFEMNRFKRLCQVTIEEFITPSGTKVTEHSTNEKDKDDQVANFLDFPASKINKQRKISLRYKILTKETILRNYASSFEIDTSILYYELVSIIFQLVKSEIRAMKFQSVELYSDAGYPLAVRPNMYVKPLSEWHLQQNNVIYVYPKKMSFSSGFNSKKVDTIIVPIENTDLQIKVPVSDWKLFCCDLKILVSQQLHLFVDAIVLKLFEVKTQKITTPDDRFQIEIDKIKKDPIRLSIEISDNWGEDVYLNAFNSKLYTSCIDQTMCEWHNFNSLLLYLAKEQLEIDKERLLEKLGLIRMMSHSPPLVYALYRLFHGLQLVLPHRVAINEGIITSLSLLLPNQDKPQIHKFCELWMYVENQASPEHKHSEIYESTYISKRTRDNPKDEKIKRLIYVFPETENTIVTWRDCPSVHEPYNHKSLSNFYIPQDKINQRFPLKHEIELYQQFLSKGITYGLVRPKIDGLGSPTVFLGRTSGKYGLFDFYSPENGKCYSYNPHDVITSNPCCIDTTKQYSNLFIVLDVSNDMSLGSQEYRTGRDGNEPNLILSHLDMGVALIELLIDSIIGFGCQYLVGVILISNDHLFVNGFSELQELTLEYTLCLHKIKAFIEKYKPQKNQLFRRSANGIIGSVLLHLIDNYPHNEEVFIFTTHEDKKYYGSKKDSIKTKLAYRHILTNIIIMSERRSETLLDISKRSRGIYVDNKIITSTRQFECSPHLSLTNDIPSHYLLEYFSHLQDKCCIRKIDQNYEYGSYNMISSNLKQTLASIDNILDRTQTDTKQNQTYNLPNVIQILRRISDYSKNPNPFCKLFSVSNQIQHLTSIIQGPNNTPYAHSVLFLEIKFGQDFPQRSPRLRFLSSYFHPNITTSGEICHPILFEDYHPDLTLRQILDSIYNMLYTPVISHAVRYKVAEIALFHKHVYKELVKSYLKVFSFDKAVSDSLSSLNIDGSFKKTHPEPYVCPLTKELFDLPVMTPEGNTYERHAILQHLKYSKTDPFTHTPLKESDLIPNNPVMSAVYKYRKKHCAKSYWWD